MPRKCIVKVVLSKEQKEILSELARRLGTSESETLSSKSAKSIIKFKNSKTYLLSEQA
jgi:hypothetical protein